MGILKHKSIIFLVTVLTIKCVLTGTVLKEKQGSTIRLDCNGDQFTQKYVWKGMATSIELDPRNPKSKELVQKTFPNSKFEQKNGCLTLHNVNCKQSGWWKCERQTASNSKFTETYFLDISEPVKMTLDISQLEKGKINCVSKEGYPKAAIKAILSPFPNGSQPIMELKPIGSTYNTAFAERTATFENPDPKLIQDPKMLLVCLGEQYRNGLLEYSVVDWKPLSDLFPNFPKAERLLMTSNLRQGMISKTTPNVGRPIFAPPNITRHASNKKWIHNQTETFTCEASVASPQISLVAFVDQDWRVLEEISTNETKTTDGYLVKKYFHYLVDQNDEGGNIVCNVTHSGESDSITLESDYISIKDVQFPPTCQNSSFQIQDDVGIIKLVVHANPNPKSSQIRLSTCNDQTCSNQVSFKVFDIDDPLVEIRNNGEHTWTITLSFNILKTPKTEGKVLYVVLENEDWLLKEALAWPNRTAWISSSLTLNWIHFVVLVGIVSLLVVICLFWWYCNHPEKRSSNFSDDKISSPNSMYTSLSSESSSSLEDDQSVDGFYAKIKPDNYEQLRFAPCPNNTIGEHYNRNLINAIEVKRNPLLPRQSRLPSDSLPVPPNQRVN